MNRKRIKKIVHLLSLIDPNAQHVLLCLDNTFLKTMARVFPADHVIVVGGGLAGFSAAHTVLEHGGRVILIDKSAFCGYVNFCFL